MDGDTNTTDDTTACKRLETDAAPPPTRRAMLSRSGKLLIYAAPLIHVFRPTQALAVSGLSPTS